MSLDLLSDIPAAPATAPEPWTDVGAHWTARTVAIAGAWQPVLVRTRRAAGRGTHLATTVPPRLTRRSTMWTAGDVS